MHYKIRANNYKLLGRGVVGICFGVVHFLSVFFLGGEVGFHVGKSSVVALVFGFGMDSCQTSVILNHCIKRGFLVCLSCNDRVSGKSFTYLYYITFINHVFQQ